MPPPDQPRPKPTLLRFAVHHLAAFIIAFSVVNSLNLSGSPWLTLLVNVGAGTIAWRFANWSLK